jgi:cytochrome c-type biogenesis protein CcmE
VTDAGKKRWVAVAALLIAGSALAYVQWGSLEKNLVYYWDAKQLLAHPTQNATIRLGGVVQNNSIQWDPKSLQLVFKLGMQKEGGDCISVRSTGAPPQMFQESMGAIVEGVYDGNVFHADRVMVKHSNEYRAPKEGERPQDIYKSLQD